MKYSIKSMIKFITLCFLISSCNTIQKTNPKETELNLIFGENDLNRFSLNDLKKKLPVVNLSVIEPHSGNEITYRGFRMKDLLKTFYKHELKDNDLIVFFALDGYKSLVPMREFYQHQAVLAFSRSDNKPFTVDNHLQNEDNIELGPFYLIWDNRKSEELLENGAIHWPYQISTIDLKITNEFFKNIVPKKNERRVVEYGFQQYIKHCYSCHNILGEGGEKGITLDYNIVFNDCKNPQKMFKRKKWLVNWLMNPSEFRHETNMPPINPKLKDEVRKEIAKEIVEYLEVTLKK